MELKKIIDSFTVMSVVALIATGSASAQSYYDDDIYYDPSKVKKEKTTKTTGRNTQQAQTQAPARQSTQLYYDGATYVPWDNVGDYHSADTYQPTGTSMRDVDEYNRHYTGTNSNTSRPDSISLQQFTEMSNTRKLARFQQSQVASQAISNDEATYSDAGDYAYDYANSYYSQPTTTINLNVVGGYPYYGYTSPWYWNYWGYDPWYGGYYRPYYSWAWGPSWSWSWGWGGPGWGPAPGWGWGGPAWGYHRPASSPGAYRPNSTHRSSSGAMGSNRYSTGRGSSYRYGGGAATGNRGNTTTNRPGYRAPLGSPSQSTGNYNTGTRGRGNTGTYRSSGNYSTPSYNSGSHNSNSGTYRNSNSGSYRNSSSGSYGGSRGGYSSGSHSSGSRGGYSSGGGGGRRGR